MRKSREQPRKLGNGQTFPGFRAPTGMRRKSWDDDSSEDGESDGEGEEEEDSLARELSAECARVSVLFEDDNSWYVGDVQGVLKPAEGRTERTHLLRFLVDGFTDDFNVRDMISRRKARIVKCNEAQTAIARKTDPLLGLRVSTYIAKVACSAGSNRRAPRMLGRRLTTHTALCRRPTIL